MRPCILLVDDDPTIREIYRNFFKAHGHVVLEAASGKEAFRIFEEQKDAIGLVLTDGNMPEGDGLWLAQQIGQSCAVILITGDPRKYASKEAKRHFTEIVEKPALASDLERLLATYFTRLPASSD